MTARGPCGATSCCVCELVDLRGTCCLGCKLQSAKMEKRGASVLVRFETLLPTDSVCVEPLSSAWTVVLRLSFPDDLAPAVRAVLPANTLFSSSFKRERDDQRAAELGGRKSLRATRLALSGHSAPGSNLPAAAEAPAIAHQMDTYAHACRRIVELLLTIVMRIMS